MRKAAFMYLYIKKYSFFVIPIKLVEKRFNN